MDLSALSVRELIVELTRIEDALRASRGAQPGAAGGTPSAPVPVTTLMLRRRQRAVVRALRGRRAADIGGSGTDTVLPRVLSDPDPGLR